MVSQRILKSTGCTVSRLREVFTARGQYEKGGGKALYEAFITTQGGEKAYLEANNLKRGDLAKIKADFEEQAEAEHEENAKICKRFEEKIRSRVQDGVARCARNASLYQAVDIAWDSAPIAKETIPLMLYAQGKIKVKPCAAQLDKLGCADDFCSKDEKGEVKDINLPKLYEVSVNLIKSYVTRRLAAQTSRYSNLWPFYRYEPRGTSQVDKLRSDAASQRIEIMSDQFGYRHELGQSVRRALMYANTVGFVTKGWTKVTQWAEDKLNEAFEAGGDRKGTTVVREGVEFYEPGPTRRFVDTSRPLAKLNTDTGPSFLGFWDIVRYGEVRDNRSYWNRKAIDFAGFMFDLTDQYASFFNYYFDKATTLQWPTASSNLSADNDRRKPAGQYSSEDRDKGAFLVHYYERINPKEEGLGDYPNPVWIRLVTAGEGTVVSGEFLSSMPGYYCGINENDDRLANTSQAHEIMPFQDQLTNILSQALLDMKIGLITIAMIDKDLLEDEEYNALKGQFKGDDWFVNPIVAGYLGTKYRDLGIMGGGQSRPKVIEIVRANMTNKVNEAFSAITNLLAIVERLMILSPQELGQPSPREASATEVTIIQGTTNSIYDFIADGIDEMRAAQKKILLESTIAYTSGEPMMPLPVVGRYTKDVIEAAGFETLSDGTETPEEAQIEDLIAQANAMGIRVSLPPARRQFTVIGNPEHLIHEVNFNSRDGAERSSNQQGAQVLTQLLGQLFRAGRSMPDIINTVGKKNIKMMFNEIFRMSGAYDLKLETSEDDEPPQLEERVAQLEALAARLTQGGGGGGGGQPAAAGV